MSLFRFSDDIAIITTIKTDLKAELDKINNTFVESNLRINLKKNRNLTVLRVKYN